MVYFFVGLVWCIIWGIVVDEVVKNKGYRENWFWLGFFFGIFALIVAISKQPIVLVEQQKQSQRVLNHKTEKAFTIDNPFPEMIDINSPIYISSYEVHIAENGRPWGVMDFFNVSEDFIAALSFEINGFTLFDDCISVNGANTFDVIVQDLSVAPRQHCHIDFELPSNDIRKINILSHKVCFANDNIVQTTSNHWIKTKQHSIICRYIDCLSEANSRGAYFAFDNNSYWQCVCGFVNTGSSCVCCEMNKASALEYSEANIEHTYIKYLQLVETRKRVEYENRIREEQQRKRSKKRRLITVSILLASFILLSLLYIHKQNNIYKSEILAITQCINTNEFDQAYQILISSQKYNRLAQQFGSILWEKQRELDTFFAPHSYKHIYRSDQLIYDPDNSRDGVCYYVLIEHQVSTSDASIYAVIESGEAYRLFSAHDYYGKYLNVLAFGNQDRFEKNTTVWSNGWMFFTIDYSSTSRYSFEDRHLAIKYDTKQNKALSVSLPKEINHYSGQAKMNDGNVILATTKIEKLIEAKQIWLFDVVKGTLYETTYDELSKRYGNITEQILFPIV